MPALSAFVAELAGGVHCFAMCGLAGALCTRSGATAASCAGDALYSLAVPAGAWALVAMATRGERWLLFTYGVWFTLAVPAFQWIITRVMPMPGRAGEPRGLEVSGANVTVTTVVSKRLPDPSKTIGRRYIRPFYPSPG